MRHGASECATLVLGRTLGESLEVEFDSLSGTQVPKPLLKIFLEGYQSGQLGRTVNPLAKPSLVRIQLLPPYKHGKRLIPHVCGGDPLRRCKYFSSHHIFADVIQR